MSFTVRMAPNLPLVPQSRPTSLLPVIIHCIATLPFSFFVLALLLNRDCYSSNLPDSVLIIVVSLHQPRGDIVQPSWQLLQSTIISR